MKNFKFSIIALLFTCSLAAIAPARAGAKEDSEKNSKSISNANKENVSGEPAPINRQILFLIITGVAIGCKLIADKQIVKNWQINNHLIKKVKENKSKIEHQKSKLTPVHNL
jgi:hypothetical protein